MFAGALGDWMWRNNPSCIYGLSGICVSVWVSDRWHLQLFPFDLLSRLLTGSKGRFLPVCIPCGASAPPLLGLHLLWVITVSKSVSALAWNNIFFRAFITLKLTFCPLLPLFRIILFFLFIHILHPSTSGRNALTQVSDTYSHAIDWRMESN